MVKFYAPWCGHCKSFAPEYEKAAKQIKQDGKPYVLANLDATAHKKAAEKHGVTGFPTVKLFINGNPIDFNGDRTAEAVISFIDKRTNPPSAELKDEAAVKEKKNGKGLRCILVTDDAKLVTEYVDAIKDVEDFNFNHASPKVIMSEFPEAKEGNVILLKDFDEGKVIYTGDFKGDKFTSFLKENIIPTVTEITEKVIEMIFRGNARKGIFLFRSESDTQAKKLEEEYKKVATAWKSKDYVFVLTDIKEGWGQKVANYFGIEESMLPIIEAVEPKEELLRYRHTGPIAEAEIKQFLQNWKDGKVPRYLKSEPEPTENSGPVYKLVGKEFKKEVLDNNLDVIVKFYAPWCGHCKKLEPIYKSLAESLSSNKNVKFMDIDATKNDIEGHPIQGFPVIKIFPGKDKSNVATYNGDRTEGDIARFIKEKCSYPVDIPELKPKDEMDKGKDDL